MQCNRMRTAWSELTVQRMLALTKAALHETAPDENLFAGAGETDWNETFELSAAQGVMVLSFTGAMRLPKELHPPFQLKLRWIAGIEAVEKKYLHYLETAKDLSTRFKENNIRMMVFKGFALAGLYPIPHSREFGDIDIFLCGKSNEGDTVLEQIAKKKGKSSRKNVDTSTKNINYTYRGVLIENHHTFLYHAYYKSFYKGNDLEKALLTMLKEAGITGNENTDASHPVNDSILFPPPEFNALHTLLHLLSHLPTNIVLRHLCDLVVVFKAYKGKIDFSVYRDLLSEAKLLKVTDAIISLSVRYLGLNQEDAPPYESDVLLENRLWNDMLNPQVPSLPLEQRTLPGVIIYNTRSITSNLWKYRLLYHGRLWKMVIHYIITRLFTLKTIVKK